MAYFQVGLVRLMESLGEYAPGAGFAANLIVSVSFLRAVPILV